MEPNLENAHRVLAALAEFGAPAGDLTPEELATPGTGFMMGRPPRRIDLLTRIPGVDFDQAWSRAVAVKLIPGCDLRVIGIEDLIANKRAAGRPQDLADVEVLERLRRMGAKPEEPA